MWITRSVKLYMNNEVVLLFVVNDNKKGHTIFEQFVMVNDL